MNYAEMQVLAAELDHLASHAVSDRGKLQRAAEVMRALAPQPNAALADGWMELTPTTLSEIESGKHGEKFWLALRSGGESMIGEYEWRQGRNPHGFNDQVGRWSADTVTHVMPFKAPAPPTLNASKGEQP